MTALFDKQQYHKTSGSNCISTENVVLAVEELKKKMCMGVKFCPNCTPCRKIDEVFGSVTK